MEHGVQRERPSKTKDHAGCTCGDVLCGVTPKGGGVKLQLPAEGVRKSERIPGCLNRIS